LDGPQRASVLELAAVIEAADGAPPLSDQARTLLGSSDVRHFVATTDSAIVGYAQLDGSVAEVVADDPAPLLDAIEAAAPDVELWAHGTGSRLLPVLTERGYERLRLLWQLRWPVSPLTAVPFAAGVTVRPFEVGRDEAAWLAVNAAAFAHHPEQGGWTLADLQAREAESWFDPAGFLLAVNDADELLGFHWTKRHSQALGEVYVIAVAPAAQGMQLGKALLIAGLAHLVEGGVSEVLLYVDDDNAPAMALYEKYGFARADHDAQYRAPSPS
jgi:mycothiol synthase